MKRKVTRKIKRKWKYAAMAAMLMGAAGAGPFQVSAETTAETAVTEGAAPEESVTQQAEEESEAEGTGMTDPAVAEVAEQEIGETGSDEEEAASETAEQETGETGSDDGVITSEGPEQETLDLALKDDMMQNLEEGQDEDDTELSGDPRLAPAETGDQDPSQEQLSGWVCEEELWYYYDEDGTRHTGWLSLSGSWFYLDEDGVMLTGWRDIDGTRYFFREDGKMLKGWLEQEAGWYYLGVTGKMRTGWVELSGNWYYLGEDGLMRTGWQSIKDRYYYFDKKGRMKTGWLEQSGSWYYFDADGAMAVGWRTLDGEYYCFRDNGRMYTGWQKLSNVWYYFRTDGSRDFDASRQEIDGYNDLNTLRNGTGAVMKTSDGYARIVPLDDSVYVEEYTNRFAYKGGLTLPVELETYRGFFSGEKANFLVFSATNPEEDTAKEVIRVVKYSKNWERIGHAAITGDEDFGHEIGYPFHYGNADMVEKDGILYLVTGHRGYVDSSVGQGHQGLLVIRVDEEALTGYVSDANLWHSFSQDLAISREGEIFLAEESEGSRATTLSRVNADGERDKVLYVLPYGGTRTSAWAIATYATCADVETAGDNVFVVGQSIDQARYDDEDYTKTYNIYLTMTPKADFTEEATSWKWITSDNLSYGYSGIRLVKINEDRLMLMWNRLTNSENEEASVAAASDKDTMKDRVLHYLFINSKGEVVSKEYTAAAPVSNVDPIVVSGSVIYTASDGEEVAAYVINGTTGAFSKSYHKSGNTTIQRTLSEGTLTISGYGSMAAVGDNSLTAEEKAAETLIIREGVTEILTFNNMENLKKVSIPCSVTALGDVFRYHNHSFSMEVFIPSSVTSIGEGAFQTGWYWMGGGGPVYATRILCEKDSYAEKYAKKMGISYEIVSGDSALAQWQKAAPAEGEVRKGILYDGKGEVRGSGIISWKKNSSGWWLKREDGWYPKNQWLKVDGKWYYFDRKGYMLQNTWQDGRWIGSDGAWTYNQRGSWKCDDKGWWYGDTSGWYPVKKWQKIDGSWYYFGADGYMSVGWQKIDGNWYNFGGIGVMQVGTKTIDGVSYTFDSNGVCLNPPF